MKYAHREKAALLAVAIAHVHVVVAGVDECGPAPPQPLGASRAAVCAQHDASRRHAHDERVPTAVRQPDVGELGGRPAPPPPPPVPVVDAYAPVAA